MEEDEKNAETIFTSIAENNIWGCPETISGPGSTIEATATLRRGLPILLEHFKIRTLVDAPCGDMNWMRHVEYPFEKFIGIDIVPAIIGKLQKEKFPLSHTFRVGNIITDMLPQADAVLCRDCLNHLPFEAIHKVVSLWKQAGFQYIIATTFPDWKTNMDCAIGEWRPLDMEGAPFHWPPARATLPEIPHFPHPYNLKSLGVWSF